MSNLALIQTLGGGPEQPDARGAGGRGEQLSSDLNAQVGGVEQALSGHMDEGQGA